MPRKPKTNLGLMKPHPSQSCRCILLQSLAEKIISVVLPQILKMDAVRMTSSCCCMAHACVMIYIQVSLVRQEMKRQLVNRNKIKNRTHRGARKIKNIKNNRINTETNQTGIRRRGPQRRPMATPSLSRLPRPLASGRAPSKPPRHHCMPCHAQDSTPCHATSRTDLTRPCHCKARQLQARDFWRWALPLEEGHIP